MSLRCRTVASAGLGLHAAEVVVADLGADRHPQRRHDRDLILHERVDQLVVRRRRIHGKHAAALIVVVGETVIEAPGHVVPRRRGEPVLQVDVQRIQVVDEARIVCGACGRNRRATGRPRSAIGHAATAPARCRPRR